MLSTPVRVVVRLPYNRPEGAAQDPPYVQWNAEKENILWEVIARSRAADSGGTDWQGLAAHLDVPLPYLLFRAQTRYEEDLRGLQDIRGAFNPLIPPRPTSKQGENTSDERPGLPRRDSLKTGSAIKLSSSGRIHTPLSVRARLTSMGANSSSRRTASSSTLTLRGGSLGRRARAPLRPATPPTSGSDSGESGESGDEATQAEEAERAAEEESALERKLRDLERMMTSETLGLVQSRRAHEKGKSVDRGRPGAAGSLSSTRQGLPDSFRVDNAGAESDRSQSVSSSGSPQGSIPSMPSPPSESQRSSPVSIHRHLSPSKSSSPPMVSPRSARGMRFQALVGGANPSEHGSSHGSSASSFSDISEMSLSSSSALESALMSNIRSGGSRLSAFRSRLPNTRGSGHGGLPM